MKLLLAVLLSAAHAAPARKAVPVPEEAAKLAPAWPDPLFDLAKAREAAKDYAGAQAALKSYLALPLSAADKRQAQDLSYALEDKAERKGEDDAAAAEAGRFAGNWSRVVMGGAGDERIRQSFTLSRDGGAWGLSGMMIGEPQGDIKVGGAELRCCSPSGSSDGSRRTAARWR